MGKASSLFNGSRDQTLINRISPTPEQREFLQTQWNDLADYLKKNLYEKYGYVMSTWLQGSYKYGTLIKPVRRGENYDVDVGLYFNWEDQVETAEPTPKQLREWVQREMVEYKKNNQSVNKIESPPKERCSRAIFYKQFHIDTPVYHLDPKSDARRLACYSDVWEDSDPKTIYKWFKGVVMEEDRDQLRRLIKYLKAWAAVSFENSPSSRPSSIVITVLVAQEFKSLLFDRIIGISDEKALITIICNIHDRLFADKKVLNPIDFDEDLNRMSDEDWNGFLPRLQALRDIAERANEAVDEAEAALIWSEAFSFLMPLPEAEHVEVIDESSGYALMTLPDIDIEVYMKGSKQSLITHRNEVPHVAKDCNLIFKIVNPHILPDYATIEWTVRNEGSEADYFSDLGHRSVGVRLIQAEEHTAYSGRHFMDCIIRASGQIYAVRRVPVNVSELQALPRNSPRPTYTKIKTFMKRRR